jgi:O-antigen ligase
VLPTLSRGGAVLFLILVAGHALFASLGGVPARISRRHLRRVIAGATMIVVILAAVGGLLALARRAPGSLASPTSQQRLTMFSDPDRFLSHMEERSMEGREAFEVVLESPWTGRGTGFTQRLERPPHNMYLELWLDGGPLAALTFVVLLVALLAISWHRRSPPGVLLAILILVSGLLSDSVLNDRTFLILLGAQLATLARGAVPRPSFA